VFPFFAGQVQAEELRPYSPPIQQQAPRMEKRQPSFQKALPAPKPVEPADPLEAYYLQFERKAATLTPEQRAQLIDAFSDQLDTARESKQWEQVAHYARLIEILGRRR
jgi:hypothetical protein